jgi:hypothetical protein
VQHSELVGMSDDRLRVLAPDATHQHYKGGLYRYLGSAMDAETGQQARNGRGEFLVAYMHCYPHERQVWLRPETEFNSTVSPSASSVTQPRFRKIKGTL